jgi:FkbM family methyltransferase
LSIFSKLKNIAQLLYYSLFRSNKTFVLPLVQHDIASTLQDLIEKTLKDNFNFLQIGANDGKTTDPIYSLVLQHNLKGICLEPIPSYFNQLKETYANQKNINLLNLAVGDKDGIMKMYKVKDQALVELPNWTKGIASKNPNHHKRTKVPKHLMEEVVVQSISVKSLFSQYPIQRLTLLIIDTEGYDVGILNQILDEGVRPKIIYFEHLYTYESITVRTMNRILNRLIKLQYLISLDYSNCLAYRVKE